MKRRFLNKNRIIRKLLTSYIVTLILMAFFSMFFVATGDASNAAENSIAGGEIIKQNDLKT